MGPVGANPVDVAQQPGQPDGEGSPKVGVDGTGTVSDAHGLRNEAGASRHLRMEGSWDRQETVRQRVRVCAIDAGTDRGVTLADGPSGLDDRRALGGSRVSLDSRPADGLHGGAQQPVLGRNTGRWNT